MSDTSLEWTETPSGVRWAWHGLEEANQAYRELAAAMHAYVWIQGLDQRRSNLLLRVLAGDDARARDTRVRAFALVLAFEGAQDARRAISQRVSTVLDDEEARTLGLGALRSSEWMTSSLVDKCPPEDWLPCGTSKGSFAAQFAEPFDTQATLWLRRPSAGRSSPVTATLMSPSSPSSWSGRSDCGSRSADQMLGGRLLSSGDPPCSLA